MEERFVQSAKGLVLADGEGVIYSPFTLAIQPPHQRQVDDS